MLLNRLAVGVNHVVGHVGSVLSVSILLTFSGNSTVHPSASWRTGPSPLTRLTLEIVTGITPFVSNCEENPPPLKYPVFAGVHCVAARQADASLPVISQNGLIHASPFLVCLPEKSRDDAPEFIKWITPFAASPSGLDLCNSFHCIRTPVGTDIREHLGGISQKIAK